MSLTYFFRIIDSPMHELDVASPSSFGVSMEKVFGDRRPRLGPIDIDKLAAMAATISDGQPNPYHQLVEAIGTYGIIQVEAE